MNRESNKKETHDSAQRFREEFLAKEKLAGDVAVHKILICALVALTLLIIALSRVGSAHAAPACAFTLSVSPHEQSVAQGATGDFALSVMFNDPSYDGTSMNMEVTGLGPGMDWEQLPSGDIGITTSSTTPVGPYTITMMASGCGAMAQTSMTLDVTQGSSPPGSSPSQINVTITTTEISIQNNTFTSVEVMSQTVISSVTVTTSMFGASDATTAGLGVVAVAAVAFAVYTLKRPGLKSGALPPAGPAGMIACPKCGRMNQPDSMFCETDGTPLQRDST